MRIPALAVLVLVAACSSQETTREGYYSGLRPLGEPRTEALATRGWLNARTLQIHGAIETPEPGDLILPGVIIGYHFRSTDDLQGEIVPPPVPGRCREVLLMIRDRRVIEADRQPPGGEYLRGLFDPETELFHPNSRGVVRPDGTGSSN